MDNQEPTPEIEVALQEGMRFQAVDQEGVEVILDATSNFGGVKAGMTPMQLVLVALGGCSAMDVISILRKKRQQVTGYRVQVWGARATTHPQVFTEIRMRHMLEGQDLSGEAVRRAVELSETKYCSVLAMLKPAVRISSTFEILAPVPPD